MFQKTRIRLTLLNASVMFVILVVLGLSMYFYLRSEIMGQIDHAIVDRARIYHTNVPRLQGVITTRPGIAAISPIPATSFARNVQLLVWNENKMLVTDLVADQYSAEMKEKLRSSLHQTRPNTIRHSGEVYRVLNINSPQMMTLRADGSSEFKIGYIQIITNISAENHMLNTVLGLIIIGIFAAAGISVLAGLYLADRALIPIRSSWDKQQQFIADASHELRTPLAVLQTHTELLLRHPDHTIEQDSREISTILKEIHRMKKLVNGLLTLSQTDADSMELSMKPLRLDRLVDQVTKQFLPLAALKSIELTSQLDTSVIVHGDEERLQQLLMIVMDNAIKYTAEHGQIDVVCQKTESMVTVVVKDGGIGIAADELPHIFERFYRSDKVRNRTEGGTGLGLAIARWIITRHNGKITAESKPNMGTTMTIMLPLVS